MNTHPNTPFGKFFYTTGIWHPSIEAGIIAAYDKLHDAEKAAVKQASGRIAVINATLQQTPDEVFTALHEQFPGVNREVLTQWLNQVNDAIFGIAAVVPQDFETALTELQEYLGRYTGNTWVSITRMIVAVAADVLLKGASPAAIIETVLEYVYQTFIKNKI